MNIPVNDVSGLYLLPFGMAHFESVWNFLNSSGLVLVPFAFSLISNWWNARAEGVDEGDTSVVALKHVEQRFWAMFICLVLVIIPRSTTPTVVFNQYSCLTNPSIFDNDNLNSTLSAIPSALVAQGLNNGSLSLTAGLVHTLSIGTNEVLTSKLSCSQGASSGEVDEILTDIAPETESMYRSIQTFQNECYLPTKRKIEDAMSKRGTVDSLGTNVAMLYSTDNKYGWAFYAPARYADDQLMTKAYDGEIIYGTTYTPLTMKVPDNWFNTSERGNTVKCSTLAAELYNGISTELTSDSDYEEDVRDPVFKYLQLFNSSVTEADTDHELILTEYKGVVIDKGVSGEITWKYPGHSIIQYMNDNAPNLELLRNIEDFKMRHGSLTGFIGENLSSATTYIGGLYTNLMEGSKAHSITLIAPLVVSVCLSLLLIVLPLLGVLCGYNWMIIWNWCLLYFSIGLVPYFLNVGILFETVLASLVDSSSSTLSLADYSLNSTLIKQTGHSLVYVVPTIWVLLVQVVGNIGGSALAGVLMAGTESGAQGAQTTFSLMQNRLSKTNRNRQDKNNNSQTNTNNSQYNALSSPRNRA